MDKYKVDKFTGLSVLLWERGIKNITGEQRYFNYIFNTQTEMLFYFYCALYAINKIEITTPFETSEFKASPFETFVNELYDGNIAALYTFIQDYNNYVEIQNQFINKDTDKKKVTQEQD
jgi:hypothetical protein